MAKKEAQPKAAVKKTAVKKVVDKKPASKPRAKKGAPSDEEIKARAYEIYIESGFQGTELENWLKAEKELLGKK